MSAADALAMTVETCFRTIQADRMDGVPVLNDALDVRFIRARPWDGFSCAVLLTPWFMSFFLIVEQAEDDEASIGSKRTFRFPSGPYEFIRGEEAAIGPYWTCSLFSPVFEFSDQETAEACAHAALEALFDEDDTQSKADAQMAAVWRGELPDREAPEDMAGPDLENGDPAEEMDARQEAADTRMVDPGPADFSRRGLLTGKLTRERRDEP
ncbi:MAG: [NiFe]-hydrogenase assembly chaperone HybE [Roseibium sp.]|nr:[NiFe]-hydrogenase assembly chaperone HybE [Roseibium sp.]